MRALHGTAAIRLGLVVAGLALITYVETRGGDWPAWRGAEQTGVSRERGLPSSAGDVLWRVPLGGRSTPVIQDGRVFAINLAGKGVTEQERVLSVDLATGAKIWEQRFNVFHTDIPNARVGWSSPVIDPETGNVYAHGVEGMFFCFSRDGRILWSRSLTETVGRISGYGGRTHTPVIDENRVVISFLNSSFGAQGKGAHRYLAMDKRTGAMLWWSQPGGAPLDTTYSVPAIAVIDGQRLLIAGNADGGVYAMQARTGEKVWGFRLSKRGINSSVVVDGYRVYATHSEENYDTTAMGRVVCIDARGTGDVTASHEIWRQEGVTAGYASPLLHKDRLYVMSNFGVLFCYDATNGKEIWQSQVGRVGKGSPVWGDGKIYAPTVNGKLVILEDLGQQAKLIDTLTFTPREGGVVELFGSPAIADGRVVFFTSEEMVCLGRPDAARQVVRIPPQPAEPPADPNARPAKIQVWPCEVLAKPGATVPLRAVAFDDRGRQLREVEAKWSVAGADGVVDAAGTFRATQQRGSVGTISADWEGLTAKARVRIVPNLPIEEDFQGYDDGDVVPWWMGVSKAKHVIETVDGAKALKKLADNRGPSFNRSRVYITPPLPTGYTVEADVMGIQKGRRRGDVGLINARYRLELLGHLKRLRVISWVPGPRFEARTDFPWDPQRWYRVKLRVDLENGKAHVRAKAWPRDEAEPKDWTIDALDPQPNLEGAAGIYAFSMAPLYFDNVRIYR